MANQRIFIFNLFQQLLKANQNLLDMQIPTYPMVNHNPHIKQRNPPFPNPPPVFHQKSSPLIVQQNHTFSYRKEEIPFQRKQNEFTSKAKFQQMSQDLAKLKKHLYEIVNNKSYKQDSRKHNKSSDNIYHQMENRRFSNNSLDKKVFHPQQESNNKEQQYNSKKVACVVNPNKKQYQRQSLNDFGERNLIRLEKEKVISPPVVKEQKNRNEMQQRYLTKILDLQINIDKLKSQNNYLKMEQERQKGMLEDAQKQIIKKQKQVQTKMRVTLAEEYQGQIRELKEELNAERKKGRNSFDVALKEQLEQISDHKQKLQSKDEQIEELRNIIRLDKIKVQQSKNFVEVEKLKHTSELNKIEQQYEINLLNKQNQIKTLKHALQTMEGKLQYSIKESKVKDDFLQQHLIGRLKSGTEQQYVTNILKKYEICFPTNGIAQKVLEEERVISDLRQRLSKYE